MSYAQVRPKQRILDITALLQGSQAGHNLQEGELLRLEGGMVLP